jgi:hypothetical protein
MSPAAAATAAQVTPADLLARSRVFNQPNGDGFTPFDLRWDDGANRRISFRLPDEDFRLEGMAGYWYLVNIFRDGEYFANFHGSVRGRSTNHIRTDISGHMQFSGEYIFTVSMATGNWHVGMTDVNPQLKRVDMGLLDISPVKITDAIKLPPVNPVTR